MLWLKMLNDPSLNVKDDVFSLPSTKVDVIVFLNKHIASHLTLMSHEENWMQRYQRRCVFKQMTAKAYCCIFMLDFILSLN